MIKSLTGEDSGIVSISGLVKLGKKKLSKVGFRLLDEFVQNVGDLESEGIFAEIELKLNEFAKNYPQPVIRFIYLEDLIQFGSFPRYPNDKIAKDLEEIDRDNSLLVFISHCWMRPHIDPLIAHPDNEAGDKFKLCINGIKRLKNDYAPKMKNCYVWLDFACMNQDDPSIERYDDIMECCDAVFTPIVDPDYENWTFSDDNNSSTIFKQYKAKLWNDGPNSYIHRSWCRIEMLYAAHIPILDNKNTAIKRHTMFEAGLAHHCLLDRRPHFLYGTREDNPKHYMKMLPPLNHSYLLNYHPLNGFLTKQSDIESVNTLIAELQPYIDRSKKDIGYVGDVNEHGEKHGYGVLVNAHGNKYEGEWSNDIQHGQATLTYFFGDTYVGSFVLGNKIGKGLYTFHNGDTYEGEFKFNVAFGYGRLTLADGSYHVGDQNNRKHGYGVYQMIKGTSYKGYYVNDLKQGHGIQIAENGDTYDGEWFRDEMHSNGVLTTLSGKRIEGIWRCGDLIEGTATLNNIKIYEGCFKNYIPHGYGTLYYLADNTTFEGDFENGRRNGVGKWLDTSMNVIQEGVWSNNEFIADIVEPIHYRVTCDGCGAYPIIGNRYHCTVRDNVDLCSTCYRHEQQLYPMLMMTAVEDPGVIVTPSNS